MPTNEKFLEWGICPRCEWHIIAKESASDVGSDAIWQCARCKWWSCNTNDFITLDDLQQLFCQWKQQEFETFKAGIILCAEAKRRDAERKKKDDPSIVGILSHYRGYTKQTINRLACLENLPECLWDPNLSKGVVWEALLMSSDGDDVDLDKFTALVEEAICKQWSLKEFKEAHGIAIPDKRQPVFDGVAELVEAGEYKFTNREVKVY